MRVAVVTVGRSDYGILRPVLEKILEEPTLELRLIVGGAHLMEQHGHTIGEIEQDGFEIAERVDMLVAADTPEAAAQSSARGVAGFADAFVRQRPQIVLLLGDRFEMHAAAVAAVPLRIPIAHLHGGEITEGAMDEQYRHALTKLAHLHLVATEDAARRVVQMGEEPWRVIVTGAPGLDNVQARPAGSLDEVAARHGIALARPFVLVTYHPETIAAGGSAGAVVELLAALESAPVDLVFTAPNADPGHVSVLEQVRGFLARRPGAWLVSNLGTHDYFTLMGAASAMVGNSSSGLIEAPSFALPVVNVGDRQRGRLRAANVIDVIATREAIADGLRRALGEAFRASLVDLRNPYGDGRAAARIVNALVGLGGDARLLHKRFHHES
ncbi:MAG: UDP-N-acetylglucosamine 2-epimerase [Acidobacteriota bacterium]